MNRYDICHEIRTLPDLLYAVSRARTIEQHRDIYNQAKYLGLAHKLPKAGALTAISQHWKRMGHEPQKRLGVKYEAARVREVAEQAIRAAAQTKDNPADLINMALEELVRARCVLPGYTMLDAMAASIRAEVNGGFFGRRHPHRRRKD